MWHRSKLQNQRESLFQFNLRTQHITLVRVSKASKVDSRTLLAYSSTGARGLKGSLALFIVGPKIHEQTESPVEGVERVVSQLNQNTERMARKPQKTTNVAPQQAAE